MTRIDYSKYDLSIKEKRDFIIVGFLCLFAASYVFYHNIPLALLSGAALPFAMKAYAAHLAQKRRDALGMQFKDLLYSLSASFAAGRHMTEALSEAKENLGLIYDNNAPMMKELSILILGMKESREGEEEVLRDFARRSANGDIRNFVSIYFTCRETGADVVKVIERTSNILADKIGIEREIRTLTAQKRFEGNIISLMPVIVILFLNIASPSYLEVLYTGILGRLIMSAALAGICFAYLTTIKLTKIEV